MLITMRSSEQLQNRFDYIAELTGVEKSRPKVLEEACRATIEQLKMNPAIFLEAQILRVPSYARGNTLPENIKIEIDGEVYDPVRKAVKETFGLDKVQNPFTCKLALSVYILQLKGLYRSTQDGMFTSDIERVEAYIKMLKGSRKYIPNIDRYLYKYMEETEKE